MTISRSLVQLCSLYFLSLKLPEQSSFTQEHRPHEVISLKLFPTNEEPGFLTNWYQYKRNMSALQRLMDREKNRAAKMSIFHVLECSM